MGNNAKTKAKSLVINSMKVLLPRYMKKKNMHICMNGYYKLLAAKAFKGYSCIFFCCNGFKGHQKNSGAAAAVVMAPTGKCTKPKSSFMLILTYLGMLSSNNSATSSVSSLDGQPQCSFCTASCHGSGEKNVGGSNQATANCFCPSCLDYNVRGSAGV